MEKIPSFSNIEKLSFKGFRDDELINTLLHQDLCPAGDLHTETQLINYRERMDLKQKTMSISKSSKESILKSQLDEIRHKAHLLDIKKQSESSQYKENKEKYALDVLNLKETLQKLEQEYSILTKSYKSKNKIQTESNLVRIKSYQQTVSDLEHRLDAISSEKEELNTKSYKLNLLIDQLKHILGMTREEIDQRYLIRAELIAENEQAEDTLDVLKDSTLENFNTQELKDYFEGCNRIKAEQEYFIKKIKLTSENIEKTFRNREENQKVLENIEKDLQKLYSEVDKACEQQEIENLENLIKETCENFGLIGLENLILYLNSLEHFDIDEEILKVQLLKVENEEKILSEAWTQETLSIKEAIKHTQTPEILSSLENDLKASNKLYYNKTSAIFQWKNEVIAAITNSKQSIPAKDRSIFLEFKTLSISQIENSQSQKSFEHIVSLYIEKLGFREKFLQENLKKLQKLQQKKESIEKTIKFLNDSLISLNKSKTADQLTLSTLICKEKSLILSIKNTDSSLISQVKSLTQTIAHWTEKIKKQTDTIEKLKPALESSTEAYKSSVKEAQSYKIIIKDLSEEESSITIQLERVLEKQRNFMINSLTDNQFDPKLSEITSNIETTSNALEELNKVLQDIDTQHSIVSAKIDQEKSILLMQLQGLTSALKALNIDYKKPENSDHKSHKVEENEAAPIPENIADRIRAKSMNKIKIPNLESPDKNNIEQSYLTSSQSRNFQSYFVSERPNSVIKPTKTLQEDFSALEKSVIDKIGFILEGSELYKRFSQRSSLKREEFDPLESKKKPPESCGYGIRYFKLSKCLTKLEIKHQLRPGFDSYISIDSIIKVIIPQTTTSILKTQKKLEKGEIDLKKLPDSINTYEIMKERRYIDPNTKPFIERCNNCKLYPFSIALNESGRLELIAKTYNVFKNWVDGINCLVKHKKIIPKLSLRIKSMYL